MFGIRVMIPGGVYHAACPSHRSKPEWPPAPDRLFSALVATAYQLGIDPAPLAQLAKQGAPGLTAPKALARQSVTLFVPVNDRTEFVKGYRQPRQRPAMLPTAPNVWYSWPGDCPEGLEAICRQVSYLGNSQTLVEVSLDRNPPAPNWLPTESGELALRVFGPNRLKELQAAFAAGLRPPLSGWHYYAPTGRQRPVGAEYERLLTFAIREGQPVPATSVLRVTEALRAGVMSVNPDPLAPAIHGHDSGPRIGYAAIPHREGIIGVALALPAGVEAPLVPDTIRLRGGRVLTLAPVTAADQRRLLQPWRWSVASQVWSTVTPALINWPKRHWQAVITRHCQHSGLPEPEQFDCRGVAGAPDARRFIASREGCKRYFKTHLTLHFSYPVAGPVLFGAGRNFGLGMMLPVSGSR